MRYKNINEAKRMAPPLPAIYAIVHYPTIYIGATINLKRRMIEHSYQLKSRPDKQVNLSAMLNQHGEDNCMVLVLHLDKDKLLTKEDMNLKEAVCMQLMLDKGYNVVSSANLLNTGKKNHFAGKHHTQQVRKKLSRKVIVENAECGVEFDSGEIAAKAFNISPALVVKRCKNKMTVNGAKWSYGGPEKIQAAIF